MTWAEFKKAVEAHGVTDEMEVHFIDISHPQEVEVEIVSHFDVSSFTVTDA